MWHIYPETVTWEKLTPSATIDPMVDLSHNHRQKKTKLPW